MHPRDLLARQPDLRPTPAQVGDAVVARVRSLPEDANVFIACDLDRLRHEADEATRRLKRGEGRPLEGLPVAVKDIIACPGFQITAGSRAGTAIPSERSPVVDVLLEAGAIAYATTNLTEYAYGIHGRNAWFGDVAHPEAPDRLAGGSSSGSAAAVARGLAAAALGTDTGGSVRIPAAACGVVGYKPAYGALPLAGVVPLSRSCDHIGLFTATVDDLEPLLDVLGLRGRGSGAGEVVALPANRVAPCEPAILEHYRRVIEALGAREDAHVLPERELDDVHASYLSILYGEAMEVHGEQLRRTPERYGPDLRRLPELAAAVDVGLDDARAHRLRFRAALVRRLGEAILLTPATRIAAPPAEGDEVRIEGTTVPLREAQNRYIAPFSFAGVPAVVVPAGPVGGGLEAAVQLVGAPGSEDRLLHAAAAVESARP